jgi:hypothetical protein
MCAHPMHEKHSFFGLKNSNLLKKAFLPIQNKKRKVGKKFRFGLTQQFFSFSFASLLKLDQNNLHEASFFFM